MNTIILNIFDLSHMKSMIIPFAKRFGCIKVISLLNNSKCIWCILYCRKKLTSNCNKSKLIKEYGSPTKLNHFQTTVINWIILFSYYHVIGTRFPHRNISERIVEKKGFKIHVYFWIITFRQSEQSKILIDYENFDIRKNFYCPPMHFFYSRNELFGKMRFGRSACIK